MLIIGFDNGMIYLVDEIRKNQFSKFQTELKNINNAKWSKSGEFLAISGQRDEKNLILYFNKYGGVISILELLKSPKLLAFNNNDQRLIVGFPNSICLVKILPLLKVLFLADEMTIIIQDHSDVTIYNIKTKSSKVVHVENLILAASDSRSFALVTYNKATRGSLINIYDSAGFMTQSLNISFVPTCVSLKDQLIVFSQGDKVGIFEIPNENSSQARISKDLKIQIFSIDDVSKKLVYGIDNESKINELISSVSKTMVTCCLICTSFIAVAISTGKIYRFNINNLSELKPLNVGRAFRSMSVNKLENIICIGYQNNKIEMYDISKLFSETEKPVPFHQAEHVQNLQWSNSGSEFCYSQKARIIERSIKEFNVFSENNENFSKIQKFKKEEDINEPQGFLARNNFTLMGYSNLVIYLLDIENISKNQNDVSFSDILSIQGKALTLVNEEIDKIPDSHLLNILPKDLASILKQFKTKPLLSYTALRLLQKKQYKLSQQLYSQLEDYSALKFIERINNGYERKEVKDSEIYLFTKQKENALEILKQSNLNNVIPKIFINYGYTDVVEENIDSVDLRTKNALWKEIGDIQKCNRDLYKALQSYEKSGDFENLLNVCFETGEHQKIYDLMANTKSEEHLRLLGNVLLKIGNIDLAAKCYEKIGDAKKAIDLCILSNYWTLAVEIAERNDYNQLNLIIQKSASQIQDKKRRVELAELYRKAKMNVEAAHVLNCLAEDMMTMKVNPIILKKVFVLSALEYRLHNRKINDPNLTSNLTNLTLSQLTSEMTRKTLNTLITSDISSIGDKAFSDPWRGAEAWHFYILTQRLLLKKKYKQAVKVVKKIFNYESELGTKRIYALATIVSFHAEFFKILSKSMTKLEECYRQEDNITMANYIDDLSFKIFTIQKPVDIFSSNKINCPAKDCDNSLSEYDHCCDKCGSNLGLCLLTGNVIFEKNYIKCDVCRHKIINNSEEAKKLVHCPLCHSKLKKVVGKEKNSMNKNA